MDINLIFNMSQTTANLLYELIEVKQEMKNSIERKGSIVEGGLVVYPEVIDNISQVITEEEKQQYIDRIERLEEQKSQLELIVDELERDIAIKNQEISELNSQISSLNRSII